MKKSEKLILIVDDNEDILEAIEITLTTEGYQVATSTIGTNINSLISKYSPDLILLDVLLSGEDGRLICKKLKTDPQTKDIPIIMLSAHPKITKITAEYGADDFLAKPFDISDLLKKIKQYI